MFFTYLASSPVSLAEEHGKHGGRVTFEENGDNNYFADSVDVDIDVGDYNNVDEHMQYYNDFENVFTEGGVKNVIQWKLTWSH